MAEKWIGTHQEDFEKGNQVVFAIALRQENYLIGAMGLSSIDKEHDHATLGYWIGKPYWNQGYCTEAGQSVLNYGFGKLNLNRIYAEHFTRNPASGRVMQKLGMKHEGCLRQHVKKWGQYEDVEIYGLLKEEFYLLK
jgi:RimJ/RimL family protein N-acetyltransferase